HPGGPSGRVRGVDPRSLPTRQGDRRAEGHRRHRSRRLAMVANQREYRITAAAISRLEEGLARAGEHGAARSPLAQQLLREGIEGQLETLREQVAEYEALQSGTVAVLEADSLTQLPDALIRARIASGLTQRALAERLGLKEQQV